MNKSTILRGLSKKNFLRRELSLVIHKWTSFLSKTPLPLKMGEPGMSGHADPEGNVVFVCVPGLLRHPFLRSLPSAQPSTVNSTITDFVESPLFCILLNLLSIN